MSSEMTAKQQRFWAAIPASWRPISKTICSNPKIDQLVTFLQQREEAGAQIYPAKNNIFAALRATPFEQVKVVIVGQDPYHGPGQAHGLCFSVPPGVPKPPSLQNIFKELQIDLGSIVPSINSQPSPIGYGGQAGCLDKEHDRHVSIPTLGNLSHWAEQGVLLLNSVLTVEAGLPASHANRGWELFTDAIILALLQRTQPTVFLLWGSYAQKKVANLPVHIDVTRHLILKAAHPSPFSAHNGFFGCRHFSKANQFLAQHDLTQINW